MKRISNRKYRLGFTLKLFGKNGKVVSDIRKQIKSKIIKELSTLSWKKAYVKVDYGVGHNDSEHTDKESAIKALNTYTEKQLLDFISN